MHRTRDLALIILAGVVTVASIGAVTALAIAGEVPSEAALGALAGAAAVGGVALGRLSGAGGEAP